MYLSLISCKKWQRIFLIMFSSVLVIFSSCNAQDNSKLMEHEKALFYSLRKNSEKVKKSPLLALLHGHGSNENDLFSLSANVPSNWIVVSVRGPYKLAENSFRWYDVKMDNGKIRINVEEEEKSRKKLVDLISVLTNKYNVDSRKIVIAGFSQGANMAQSIGLGSPNIAAGFGVFSGRFVEEFIPYINTPTVLKNSRAFISHGSGDNMLPKTYGAENLNKLTDLGIQTTYCEDTNGHSISPKQWNEFLIWLKNFN